MLGKAIKYGSADFAVATTQPVTIYWIEFISGAAAGTLLVRSGGLVTDPIALKAIGVVSGGVPIKFGPAGILFPAGCFIDLDANITDVTVGYEVL